MITDISQIKFDENGLIPVIVQDATTHQVLTLAYMNAESLQRTLETRETWFWSRSRNQLWHKGETSGNTQSVVELIADCDCDALVIRVDPNGPACHTGSISCFHNALDSQRTAIAEADRPGDAFEVLYRIIQRRERERPAGSYTSYLFNEGIDKILKKVGEEASETIIAAKNDDDVPFVGEVADLIYHLLVLMVARGVSLDQIKCELDQRASRKAGPQD